MFLKTGQTFRQLINLKDLDACDILGHVNDFPMLKSAFEWLNTTLAGMVHKCPYAVSKKRNKNLNKLKNYSFKEIKIVNATYAGIVGDDIPSNWQVLPNGIYKTCLGLSDSLDEKIFEVTFFQETSIRKRFFTDLYM